MTTGINEQNAGLFSAAAYTTIGEPVPTGKLPNGWSEMTNLSDIASYSSKDGNDAFRMFVNTDTQQIVIAFKGTDTWMQGKNDVTNAGAADYASIEPLAQAALNSIQDPNGSYAGYQIVTDGHSLGGGMAQSFALENGLSGFGQNSLPVAPSTITNTDFFSSTAAFNTALQNYQDGLTQDSNGNPAHFSEVNVSGQC